VLHAKRVLFVDDHPLILSGLAEHLGGSGCQVVTAKRLADAAKLIDEQARFDVLLLDINLGKENGLALLENPPAKLPERVVLLSGATEQEWVMQGFLLGALGFIPKNVELDEVMTALAALMDKTRIPGSGWVWNPDVKQLVDAYELFPRHTVLTPKEREVFMKMREGKLDKQVADELGLSIHTVRVHIRAIYRKRGHNRRSEQEN
jgi:DNA-binding NarL/FixJ family response regulator